jgi:2',3'-cyclic-nucleotide 2'-phosphodiesterase (5'-nucleotidase family)
MVKLGYSVVNVAEREVSLGYDDFVKKTAGFPLTFVSANIVRQDTKAPVFKPYTIVEIKQAGSKKPLRVAVTGVTRYSPVWLKAGPEGSNLGIVRPADPIKALLPEMKKASDVVVVLTAMAKAEAQQLAIEVPGIDFIVGAYGGVYNSNEESAAGTRVFYSGNQGKRVGETRVYLGADRKVATTTSYMHFLTDQYGNDPDMTAFVGKLTVEINKAKGIPETPPPAESAQPGATTPSAPPPGAH